MKYEILFSGKNKKIIPKGRLLKFLPSVLSVKALWHGKSISVLSYLFSFTRHNFNLRQT